MQTWPLLILLTSLNHTLTTLSCNSLRAPTTNSGEQHPWTESHWQTVYQIPSKRLEFFLYNHSVLNPTYQTAIYLFDFNTAMSTTLPTSPPNRRVLNHSNPTPSASFKPPKLVTDHWNDFYPWLSYIIHGFTLTGWDNKAKVTIQAILLDKKWPLNNITD